MGNKDVNSDLPEQIFMNKNLQNDSLLSSSESFCGVSEIETIDAIPRSGQLPLFESLLWISQIAPLPTETALREKTYSIGTEH